MSDRLDAARLQLAEDVVGADFNPDAAFDMYECARQLADAYIELASRTALILAWRSEPADQYGQWLRHSDADGYMVWVHTDETGPLWVEPGVLWYGPLPTPTVVAR